MSSSWKRVSLTVTLLFAVGVSAARAEAPHWCATSQTTIENAHALASWAAASERVHSKGVTPAAIRQSGDLLVLEADDFLVPFDNRADLEGQTLTFTPASQSSYRVDRSPLAYDTSIGERRTMPSNSTNDWVLHSLQQFTFPFQGRTINNLYISERFAVFFSAPAADGGRPQLGPLDVITPRVAVVAPYLQPGLPRTLVRSTREVFVRETQDSITITWRAAHNPVFPYNPLNDGALDIQLVLRSSGEIRFSYRTLTNIAWGSAVITSGDETARTALGTLALVNDPAGDGSPSSPLRNLLDIREVELQRVADSELIRVRVRLGGRIAPGSINGQVILRLYFDNGADLVLFSGPSIWRHCSPGWGCTTAGSNVEFLDDGVVMYVLDRYLNEPGGFIAETYSSGQRVDFVSTSLAIGSGTPVDVKLSSVESGAILQSPILEAFTVPVLNPDGVWERVRDQFALWEEEVDGVAIYQNFTTDIRTYATAYSTVGNSGADGVWAFSEGFYGSDVPRTPALLHMNEVEPDRRDTDSLRYRDFLLGHELGHRWLYGFNINHQGEPSFVLGPDGGHPAQYVHTPAAFPVYTSRDYSVMGGSHFANLGGGEFGTPTTTGAFGYSWHELYLMGLAAPSEVDPWFFLADTEPRLGNSYHPPTDTVVKGNKVDVGLSQMIATMGPRFPSSEDSQRTFRVLFVLLEKPGSDIVADESILQEYASRFPGYFNTATGSRGIVTTSLPIAPASGFSAPLKGFTGQPISFRDESANYPAAWSWSFGDGRSAQSQHAEHAYRTPGTYTVTLRVSNSRGESVTTREIVIEQAPRTRPARP